MNRKAAWRIYLFGPLRLEREGTAVAPPAGRAARSLLAWLLLHPVKQHARPVLLGRFWPDLPEAKARRALIQTLWQIRQAAPGLIQANRRVVYLNRDTAVFTDVAAFQELLHPGQPPEEEAARLRQAVELAARGPFLAGSDDDWILLERERLREQYLQTLERLAQIEKRRGHYREALQAIARLTETDPLRESAWQERMRLHAALEQPEEALRQYDAYRRILARQLNDAPRPATTTLAQNIARQSGAAARFLPPALPPALSGAPLPLIGRAAEREALLRQITAALNRQGGVVFITGEPGLGKTRLLQEAAEAAGWRGAAVAWGHAQEQAAAPFTPFLQALDAALSPLRLRQLRPALPELWLAAAAELLPKIKEVFPRLPPPAPLPPDQAPLRQLEALTRLALALGETAPHVLILEDMHWAGRRALEATAWLARRLAGSQILLLISFRLEDAQANETVWRGLQEIEAAGLRLRLPLAPLDAAATAELTRQWLGLPQTAPHFSQRLHQECGGNPFHTLETLRALQDGGLLCQDERGDWHTPYDEQTEDYVELPIPAASEDVIRQRLARLTPEARLTAQTAALIGGRFTYLLLEAAVPLAARQTLAALDLLAQRRFLEETADGYRFSHDQIRRALLASLPPDRARELHGRIARALEKIAPDDPAPLARHYAAAENGAKAIQYNSAAAAQARQNYAPQAALDYLNCAIRFAPPPDLLYELTARREELLHTLGRREEQAADLAQMARLANTPARQIETGLRRARWLMAQSRFDEARREAGRAGEIAAQIGDTAGAGRAEMALYDITYTQSGDAATAAAHLRRARARFRAAGDEAAELDARLAEARLLRGSSEYEKAAAILQEILARPPAGGPAREGEIHWLLGTIRMEQGDVAQAAAHFRPALEQARRAGDRRQEMVVRINWGNLFWIQGQIEQMLAHYRPALRIARETGYRSAEAQILVNLASMQSTVLGAYETAAAQADRALALFRELKDPLGEGQALAVLGQIALDRREWEQARRQLEEGIAILTRLDEKFIRTQALCTLALLAVEEGRPAAGWPALAEAERLCRETGMESQQASLAALRGLLLLAEGRPAEALEAITAAAESPEDCLHDPHLTFYWRSLILAANGRAAAAGAAVEKAYQLLQEMLAGLPAEQRERSLSAVPEHRRIARAWQARQAGKQTVELPPAGLAGRRVPKDALVSVVWTPWLPEDEAIPGKKARRQRQLRRLLDEAAAQGAAPTIAALAGALHVSAGTIKRDLAALRRAAAPAK